MLTNIRLAVIGQRELCGPAVEAAIMSYLEEIRPILVVSGGAKGVDSIAASLSRQMGIDVLEFFPDLSNAKSRIDFISSYYKRNQMIVDNCDVVLAIVGNIKTGCTFATVKMARKSGKPVILHRIFPSCQ